jgi:hypothetical protein
MGTNEKIINQLYLKQLELSLESLDVADKEHILNVVNSCLYVNGTAVFKARTLALQFNPSQDFYDLNLCINQSNNSALNDEEYILKKTITKEMECLILENPVDHILKSKHSQAQNITFIIYEVIYNAIKRIELDGQFNFANINVEELPTGNYIYKSIFDNKTTSNGKILLQ